MDISKKYESGEISLSMRDSTEDAKFRTTRQVGRMLSSTEKFMNLLSKFIDGPNPRFKPVTMWLYSTDCSRWINKHVNPKDAF